MNPFRSLLVKFSRIPVGILLILIIATSAAISIAVTSTIANKEKAYELNTVNSKQEETSKQQ